MKYSDDSQSNVLEKLMNRATNCRARQAGTIERGFRKGVKQKNISMVLSDEAELALSDSLMMPGPAKGVGNGVVAQARIELATRGFSIRCSTD